MVPYKPIHYHPHARLASRPVLQSATESEPPPYAEVSFRTSFACISLHKTDRIRLIQFPPEDISLIRIVIQENWSPGLQEDGVHGLSHEFKCHGNPWAGYGIDAIRGHVLMRALLAHLFSRGWILTASTDVSKAVTEKDTLIFRKQVVPPPESEWVAISFDQGDRLRLIAPPPELVDAFQALLRTMGLLQEAAWKDEALGAFEFKISGWPWRSRGEETVMTRLLLLKILETLEIAGWSLYCTVRQNGGNNSKSVIGSDTDSWYCVRAVDWVPGNSVLHR